MSQVPTDSEIAEWMRAADRPLSIRDVSDGMMINHETATQRIRRMARPGGVLRQNGTRTIPRYGDAKLYEPLPSNKEEERSWDEGTSLLATLEAGAVADLVVEINGALATWSRWVKAGRPRLVWQHDAHLAMSLAMDKLVSSMQPHERAALEKVWGVRAEFQSRRHDLSDAYDDAFTALRSFYRLDAVPA